MDESSTTTIEFSRLNLEYYGVENDNVKCTLVDATNEYLLFADQHYKSSRKRERR